MDNQFSAGPHILGFLTACPGRPLKSVYLDKTFGEAERALLEKLETVTLKEMDMSVRSASGLKTR